jgi:hypothetical protein
MSDTPTMIFVSQSATWLRLVLIWRLLSFGSFSLGMPKSKPINPPEDNKPSAQNSPVVVPPLKAVTVATQTLANAVITIPTKQQITSMAFSLAVSLCARRSAASRLCCVRGRKGVPHLGIFDERIRVPAPPGIFTNAPSVRIIFPPLTCTPKLPPPPPDAFTDEPAPNVSVAPDHSPLSLLLRRNFPNLWLCSSGWPFPKWR